MVKLAIFSMVGGFLSFLIASEFVIVIGGVFNAFDDEVVAVGVAYFYGDAVADFMA